ncbi:hypothetical protein XthCFBP4691_08845 [Xanthomonas theicola]|uniref:DUF5329 domain-containing protein n=2 Tax=Xanthomonas theicola TaxID=56464 RepID=A0A2S6ZFY5_9XANT|nr:DUF5329 domain-containing protein [Xanthomonas theicola]PPT91175.1 hypothetical protein XthCFBP4691_08845 [Xanthomonas theicola]QNH27011.1 DUF5329 domain-containing protein [Xanthomonas theicola]
MAFGLACAGVVAAMAAVAVPAQAAAREIRSLLAALQASPCRFQRNGSWYSGAQARAHLQRKYDYLRQRDLAASAEQFIERGASRSSVSGQPYRVACPGQPEQDAAAWFAQRLAALRRHAASAAPHSH